MTDDLRDRITRTETKVETLEKRFMAMEQMTQEKFDEVVAELKAIREQIIVFFGGLKMTGKVFSVVAVIVGILAAVKEIIAW